MLLSECCRQLLHYFCVLVSRRLDDTKVEFGRNAKSEDSIYIGPHNFQVEQSLEKLLEVEKADVHNLDVEVLQVNLQLRHQLLVLHVLHMIIFELLGLVSIFLHAFDVVDGLLLHASYPPELVAFCVLGIEVLLTVGDYSWLIHQLFMLFLLLLELLVYLLVDLLLTESILVSMLPQDGQGSLLPGLKVISVKVQQSIHVSALKLLNFLFVYYHQDGSHDLRAMGVHEHIFSDFLFVNHIPQVLLHERWTIFLSKLIQLVFYFCLLVHYLF